VEAFMISLLHEMAAVCRRTIEYQANVPQYLDIGLQRSTIHDQSALYRMRGKGFAALKKVGFASHRRHGNFGEVCGAGPEQPGPVRPPDRPDQ
jgi:hypothetical protein